MDRRGIVWVNLTNSIFESSLIESLKAEFEVHSVSKYSDLGPKIHLTTPEILFFDIDAVDTSIPGSLAFIKQTCEEFPSIPVVLVVKNSTEEFAICTFRMGVHDYLARPVSHHELHKCIARITDTIPNHVIKNQIQIESSQFSNQLNVEGRDKSKVVLMAKSYVDDHLDETIDEKTVAQLCNMSYHYFSRTFKRDNGETFSRYVMRRRIRKAAEMLTEEKTTISDICYSVGFSELSYFGKVFKDHYGITPSDFRSSF